MRNSYYEGPKSKYYFFVKPHDDEQTAAAAAHIVLAETGGTLHELVNNEQRLIAFTIAGRQYVADPNRIFTNAGIAATLAEYSEATTEAMTAVEAFALAWLEHLQLHTRSTIVTLHNNTEGEYGINTYVEEEPCAAIHINPAHSTDDFYFVTTQAAFDLFKARNYNVVLQHPHDTADDGSLSIWAERLGIPYINVEAMHGHLTQQVEMVRGVDINL